MANFEIVCKKITNKFENINKNKKRKFIKIKLKTT